jgi:hypothetical protein
MLLLDRERHRETEMISPRAQLTTNDGVHFAGWHVMGPFRMGRCIGMFKSKKNGVLRFPIREMIVGDLVHDGVCT